LGINETGILLITIRTGLNTKRGDFVNGNRSLLANVVSYPSASRNKELSMGEGTQKRGSHYFFGKRRVVAFNKIFRGTMGALHGNVARLEKKKGGAVPVWVVLERGSNCIIHQRGDT